MAKQDKNKSSSKTGREKRLSKRRRTTAIGWIIAIALLIGSVPLSHMTFNKLLESDANIDLISTAIAKVIPDSLVNKVFSVFSSTESTDAETEETLQAEQLEGADVSDPNSLAETTPVSTAYYEKTLIFGDASYNVLADEELFPGSNMFTITSCTPSLLETASFTDSETGMSGTIDEIIASRTPDQVYLAFGFSGISEDNNDDYLKDIETLVKTIQEAAPEVAIVVISLPPTDADNTTVTNEQIRTLNGSILSLVRELDIYYLNTFSSLCNETGILIEDYNDGEGNLNEDGYEKLMDVFNKHAVPTS